MDINFLKLTESAIVPDYATPGAAGMDLHADVQYRTTIEPGKRALISTGIAIQLPPGYEAQVRPRSGLALKRGITVLNSPGTIDSDYTGAIGVILVNHGEITFDINPGDRIAQLVIAPYTKVQLQRVGVLNATERGAGGFGSTGTDAIVQGIAAAVSSRNCLDCKHHKVIPDPDPHDSFCIDDVAVVCTRTRRAINMESSYLSDRQEFSQIASSCRPYNKRKESETPTWCPDTAVSFKRGETEGGEA